MKMTFQEIRIIATGPCIANQLRDVNTICRRSSKWVLSTTKVSDTRLADPESHEDVRKLIEGQDNKNRKKIRHGLLLCGENGMDTVLTWKHQYRNCNTTWTFEVWEQWCGYRLIIWEHQYQNSTVWLIKSIIQARKHALTLHPPVHYTSFPVDYLAI
jgi:hypothetical protein